MSLASRQTASQSCSIAWSRSTTDILSIWDDSSIEAGYELTWGRASHTTCSTGSSASDGTERYRSQMPRRRTAESFGALSRYSVHLFCQRANGVFS